MGFFSHNKPQQVCLFSDFIWLKTNTYFFFHFMPTDPFTCVFKWVFKFLQFALNMTKNSLSGTVVFLVCLEILT